MPVTKTAKRALRSSKNKEAVNKKIVSQLEIAIRAAKKSLKKNDITTAISLADRTAKKKIIHRNKASRLKSQLSKLAPKTKSVSKKKKK